MNILITGVGCNNKGSELMFVATLEHVRARYPDAKVVCGFVGDHTDRYGRGLYQLAVPRYGRFARIVSWLPLKTRLDWGGFILPKEIDVILDPSGFCFGDQWGPRYVEGNVKIRLECKKPHNKLILLPQSFGTFNDPKIRELCTPLFEKADLIFAREPESFEYVKPLLSTKVEKLHFAHDFTNLVQGFVPKSFPEELYNHVGVIPNQKMLKKADESAKKSYISFLETGIHYLQDRQVPFFILKHQREDQEVVDLLNQKFSLPLPVVQEQNPQFIKGILGTCRFLLGSRYHGLANGLTQGVPVIGTAWSHKYTSIFDSYQLREYLLDDLTTFDRCKKLIDHLLDESSYAQVCEQIREHGKLLCEETRKMWKIVDDFIEK